MRRLAFIIAAASRIMYVDDVERRYLLAALATAGEQESEP